MTETAAECGAAGRPGFVPSILVAGLEHWLGEQQRRLVLWLPVLFGAGAASYFAAGPEPDPQRWVLVLLIAGWAASAAYARGNWTVLVLATAPAVFAAGLLAMQARAHAVATPTLAAPLEATIVEGRILSATRGSAERLTVTLAPSRIERWNGGMPPRIRLTFRGVDAGQLMPGRWLVVRATLRPPPGPAAPGAYDFARSAWFQGIGAVGFALGQPGPAPPRALGLLESAAGALATVRWAITERIHAALPGPEGAIAAALITGDRGALPDAEQQALRDSGLQHILSISGLHMALVGLGTFMSVRLVLALLPSVAVRLPAKKCAAAAGLVAIALYLVISGASVPAQRSFLMLGLVFVAVVLDRDALTMRLVAIAAGIILALTPEASIDPSFQMSFAAAAAIVAIYEGNRSRLEALEGWPAPMVWMGSYIGGLAATSLIAGLATAPLTAYHFNVVSAYGVAANLLAMPIVGFVTMPAAAATALVMPFGFEVWPLAVLGWSIGAVTGIAVWVASWPGAVYPLAAMPPLSLALFTTAGAWLVLWQGRTRWLGVMLLPVAIFVAAQSPLPHVLIAGDGRNAAIRIDNDLAVAYPQRSAFTVTMWQSRAGQGRSGDLAPRLPFRCDSEGCAATFAAGGRSITLLLAETRAAIRDDCGSADIIASAEAVERLCRRGVVIGAKALAAGGAHALYVTADGVRIETVSGSGSRPWRRAGPAPQ